MNAPMTQLLEFLRRLEKSSFHYSLASYRDSVMVLVQVPGEHWEVEFFADGSVEVEVYTSDGEIRDENSIEELFSDGGATEAPH